MDTHDQAPTPRDPFAGITNKLYEYFPPGMQPTPEAIKEAEARFPLGVEYEPGPEYAAARAEIEKVAMPSVTRYVGQHPIEVQTDEDVSCTVTRYASEADREAGLPAFSVKIGGDRTGWISLPDAAGQLRATEITDPDQQAQLASNVLDFLESSTDQPPEAQPN